LYTDPYRAYATGGILSFFLWLVISLIYAAVKCVRGLCGEVNDYNSSSGPSSSGPSSDPKPPLKNIPGHFEVTTKKGTKHGITTIHIDDIPDEAWGKDKS